MPRPIRLTWPTIMGCSRPTARTSSTRPTDRKGRYNLNLNYTFGKAMGIINAAADPFNLANDYGVQPTNRTHLFNAAYSIELGNPAHDKILGGFVNGWQLSGITQVESGANLTGFSSGNNFNLNLN